jgi:hypothetical protein
MEKDQSQPAVTSSLKSVPLTVYADQFVEIIPTMQSRSNGYSTVCSSQMSRSVRMVASLSVVCRQVLFVNKSPPLLGSLKKPLKSTNELFISLDITPNPLVYSLHVVQSMVLHFSHPATIPQCSNLRVAVSPSNSPFHEPRNCSVSPLTMIPAARDVPAKLPAG